MDFSRIAILFLFVAPLCAAPVVAEEGGPRDRLVVAADEWCPYNCQPGSERPGFLVEVLQEIFSPLGVSVEYQVMPWRRALVETERGEVDAALGAVRGNHGRNYIGDENLGIDETILVVRRGDELVYGSPASLDGRAVGMIADYTYDGQGPLDTYLARRIEQSRDIYVIHQDKPLQSLLAMLVSGRIDVFPENRYVAQHAIAHLGYRDRVSLVDTAVGDEVFIAFTPNAVGMANLAILDEGIRRLRASGRLAEILAHYGIALAP